MSNIAMQAGGRTTYTAYKPSGVVWLGHIPDHWEVKRAKALLARNDGGVWGEDFDDDGVIVLRSTEQTVDGEWSIVEPAKRRLSAAEHTACLLQEGDLVVTKSSGSSLHIGKTSIVTKEVEALNCCFSNFMQRLRVKRGVSPRFVWYLLNGELGRKQFDYYSSTTTGLANLNGSIIGNVGIAVPPRVEQRAIANFLDRETARIDSLIERKRRQIELLHEKRAALISHAVTKGLNPDAPMKDSGIEWLGEVPAHWDVVELRRVASDLQTGPFGSQLHAADYIEGGIPIVNPANIQEGVIVPDFRTTVDKDASLRLRRHALEEGDIIFGRRGEMGRSALVGKPERGFLCGTGSIRVRLRTRAVHAGFVASFLRHPGVHDHLLLESVGSTMDNLNTAIIGRIPIVVPPMQEQMKIEQQIRQEQDQVDRLVTTIGVSIERLREYRTALISAAVTGKIDVRKEETG